MSVQDKILTSAAKIKIWVYCLRWIFLVNISITYKAHYDGRTFIFPLSANLLLNKLELREVILFLRRFKELIYGRLAGTLRRGRRFF